ncbi:MAG TPA: MerR family transcriptional regulator [Sporomusaceae bacterium]|nr:transcriptional regulator, effector-binding domain/component [Anaerospora sp.]HAK73153.1 MerR family transcriptional regulator [Sporomusaceae bacterium]
MQNKFTIGELAKLINVPVKTLRYYDEIGLLKPAEVDKSSRYRYYTSEQFEQLDMINYLKWLGISLKDIKDHLEKRNVANFLQLLKSEQEATLAKIKELELISGRFDNRLKEIEAALRTTDIGTVTIRDIEARTVLKLEEKLGIGPELELSVRKLEKMTFGRIPLFIGRVGITVSQENLMQGKFDQYDSVFILLEENIDSMLSAQPLIAGKYACIYFRGSHSHSRKYYDLLLEHIAIQGYRIAGEALERTIIDQFITKEASYHLTEIQIPIIEDKD